MIRCWDTSSALTLLILLTYFFHLSAPNHVSTPHPVDKNNRAASSWQAFAEDAARMGEEGGSVEKEGERVEERKEERKDELFNDVDPKILAAVLLEALNMPHTERKREWGWGNETEKEEQEGRKDANQEQEKGGDVKATEEDSKKDDQMLALLMTATSAQGRDEQEREEDERRKVQEEEMLTEKVMSHTTSQTVPVKMQQQSTTENGEGEEMLENEVGAKEEPHWVSAQQGSTTLDEPQQQGEQRNDEEEYQLSPEELKNLESMMKEFQSLTTAVKRKGDSMQGQRERRGYSPFNDVLPKIKDYDLAMSKMKLKWQEETQKAMNFPSFLGGSFMDVAEDNDLNNALSNPAHPLPPPEDDLAEEDVPDMEVEEEDILSPEEEEAQAKAEQEEVRRQAAEAQRAKMEEEKLADIASDMLLQYMAKQNSGNKREKEQMWKYSSSLPNTAEDKRSDEKQEVMEDDDDDIDPQTIDKLIEISSKLHLPADDVVDIIGDVEKKKKKDVQPETASLSSWQQTLMPQSSMPSTNGISVSKITTNQKGFPLSKQTTVNPLKVWFQEKTSSKPSLPNQDSWMKPPKANQDLWLKLQKPLSTNQDLWPKQNSFWTTYPSFSFYPSYYQKRPYRGYYPIYYSPPPKPKPHYYMKNPAFNLNNLLRSSANYNYYFTPQKHFRNWIQPKQRNPPARLHNPFYSSYALSLYPQTFQTLHIPKPRSSPQLPRVLPYQNKFYYSPLTSVVARNQDYHRTQAGDQAGSSHTGDLDNYIQQILTKRPQMLE